MIAGREGRRLPGIWIPLAGPLVGARFVERPNRFLLLCTHADGAVHESAAPYQGVAPGERFEAHMADPGRLRELLIPGKRVWLRRATPGPTRRTQWTAVLVESPDGSGLVSVDTTLPNRLIHQALRQNALREFDGWELERSEVTLGDSRIDFLLRRADGRKLALEVKSVTLVEDDVALFPDAVTARGARHVRELTRIAGEPDWEAAILFVLQRPDASRIAAAASIDPAFAAAVEDAHREGVRILGRRCHVSLERLTLGDAVPAAPLHDG